MMDIMFWATLAVIAFGYVGYPLCMATAARFFPRPVEVDAAYTPTIDVLLVIHNAQTHIAGKIENLLALDYPQTHLRVNVVCDGCSDASESMAREHACARVRVFSHANRRGKSACIGDTLSQLDSEIVLFCDVRQRVHTGAARALASALSDPRVGAASGELVLVSTNGYGKGIDGYWRYEKILRRLESASGSLVGVTGALYAARRTAIAKVPDGIILDDMWVPLAISAAGLRVIVAPGAMAFDDAPAEPHLEERRKRRTLAGNFQLLHLWPALAVPGKHPLALRLWGHKWLRLLTPWLMGVALGLNILLAGDQEIYAVLLALQLGCYAMALLGRLLPMSLSLPPIRLATTFLSLNVSAALAMVSYLSHRDIHLWSATPAGRFKS